MISSPTFYTFIITIKYNIIKEETVMAERKNKNIPRAKFPEQVGISSKEIGALIRDFDSSGIEVHSMMFIRHGKVAHECYRYPYNSTQCIP